MENGILELSKDKLKALTLKYWAVRDWNKENDTKPQRYVRELLRGELACKQIYQKQ